ncbi:MAG: flagellin [Oscillibacter sp.]|nr:flagellin [Oscillibacter sp.]
MRIQHNIMAMNAYRNYNTNTSALAKNLEKLSSGYKINRAGDDAAGLAISEKMRAQITGLNAAQKNVKDGISLVKTAEGAMQEIQDMLNRMDYLATQSANGTYDDPVDRKNLQKEVNALRDEINRIADSANFNGIKLLDGSLAAEGSSSTKGSSVDLSKLGVDLLSNATEVSATKGQYATEVLFAGEATAKKLENLENGDKISLKVEYTDENGASQTKELTFKIGKDQAKANDASGIYLDDGSEEGIWLADLGTAGEISANEFATAAKKALEKDSAFKGSFNITVGDSLDTPGTDGLTFESRTTGADGAKIDSIQLGVTRKSTNGATPTPIYQQVGVKETVKAEDALKSIDFKVTAGGTGNPKIFDVNADPTKTQLTDNINDAIFEINGEKFVFINKPAAGSSEADKDFQEALRKAGVTHWIEVGTADTITGTDVEKMANKIATATGLKVDQGSTTVNATTGGVTWTSGTAATDTKLVFRPADPETTKKPGGGLTLQIGDTADKFNQLNVNVGDMHTNAMGTGTTTLDGKEIKVTKTIADIDISNLADAQDAIGVIKNAINYVSEIRGDLGAVQNRLEHTQKNLSVMAENIQDAESTIRDTDVAEEMMSYTKNNILIQSAQAMLAQANAVPQGVLQLLG